MLLHECRFTFVAQKAGRNGHCSARIEDVDYGLAVMRRNLNGSVRPARGCPADEERQLEALTFHLSGHMYHLVERRSDQPAESDHVRLLRLGAFEDLFAGHHHAHVDDFVVIAGKHDADNILANVVHVAFDRREYDFPLCLDHFPRRSPSFLLGFHVGSEVRHGLLHHAG